VGAGGSERGFGDEVGVWGRRREVLNAAAVTCRRIRLASRCNQQDTPTDRLVLNSAVSLATLTPHLPPPARPPSPSPPPPNEPAQTPPKNTHAPTSGEAAERAKELEREKGHYRDPTPAEAAAGTAEAAAHKVKEGLKKMYNKAADSVTAAIDPDFRTRK